MIIEWNEDKNKSNRKKHGLSFEKAQQVFDDPLQINIQDRHSNGEERWQTIGIIDGLAIVLVAHTLQDNEGNEIIHIISARKATKRERQHYEKND
jgi:uncharacterized DUF497 family protein